MEFPDKILKRLEQSGVVAGFSVDKPEHAVPVCRALLEGGIDAIELTLRTPAAMEGLKLVCSEVKGLLVGVGTILTPEQAIAVKEAGADFGVAPGLNPRVITAAQEIGLPFAPGIVTPSELEQAIELGCRFVKFFPAEATGGITYLKSMAAPYKHLGIRYFPLGGVNLSNLNEYLAEEIVPVVGGSWLVKTKHVAEENWAAITEEARAARRHLEEA